MGFNHKNQQYADETSYQFAYKHPRQMNCGGQIASFPDFSPCRGITANYPCPEGDREGILSQFRGKVRCGGDNVLYGGTPTRDVHAGSCSSEAAGPLHSKRPFSEDMLDREAIKRVRQVGQNCEDSYVHLASSSGTSDMQPTSDVVRETEIRSSASVSEDPTKRFPSSIPSFPWLTSISVDEDTRSESPVRLSFFPGYFEDGRRPAALKRTEESNLLVFHYPPQKLVPLGPNHQAEIPIMRSRHFKNSCSQSDDSRFSHKSSTCSASAGHLLVQEDNSDKWMGTCIVSMPDSNPLALEESIRKTTCIDDGSIRCVRQRVNDARESLKNRLGKKFLELGFCDMGEVVAQKWTEEDGQLFHEVVASNPVSLGKNFWDVLSLAFPSRSSKELVSYYFNVFMLRKRAEQNRAAPLNVDSDDDEWQESDDGQFEMTDEDDEDSAVESLAYRDDVTCNDSHMYDEAEDEDVSFDSAFSGDGVSKFTPKVQPVKCSSQDGAEDQNVQDESCTSFEEQHNTDYPSGGPAGFVETHVNQVYRNDSLSGLTDYVYHGGYCDPHSWDISYLPGTEKDVDFLPTSNVIEEFGKDSWGI